MLGPHPCTCFCVQVKVSLPESLTDPAASCPACLVLELWAAGSLACSYSAMVLPSRCQDAFTELQALDKAGGEDSAAFLEDLVHWLHFRVPFNAAHQEQQQPTVAHMHSSAAFFADEQQVVLMADVGRDLLRHSLNCGMVGVSGEGRSCELAGRMICCLRDPVRAASKAFCA